MPSDLVVKKGRKTLGRSAAGMPGPLSVTEMRCHFLPARSSMEPVTYFGDCWLGLLAAPAAAGGFGGVANEIEKDLAEEAFVAGNFGEVAGDVDRSSGELFLDFFDDAIDQSATGNGFVRKFEGRAKRRNSVTT